MQIEHMNSAVRKKIIVRAATILIVLLVIFTFLSKTIENIFLPVVETQKLQEGMLDKSITVNGILKAADSKKMCAEGQWTIKEVRVKCGDRVLKGDILAVADTDRQTFELKNAELDLMRLKNSMTDYIAAFSPIDLGIYEEDIRKAEDMLNTCRKNEKTIAALYDMGDASRQEVEDTAGKTAEAVDNYYLKLKSSEVAKRQNVLKKQQYERIVEEKKQEMEIAQDKLNALKKSIPEGGNIKAVSSGLIRVVGIEAHSQVSLGEQIFEIIPYDTGYYVSWQLNETTANEVNTGGKVVFSFKNGVNAEDMSVIDTKEYLQEKEVCNYTSHVTMKREGGNQADRTKYVDTNVEVHIIKESDIYASIIASSALFELESTRYVFILCERAGPLGKEYYSRMVEVSVKNEDDFNSAISSPTLNKKTEIIVKSSKPITDGGRVKLR